MITSISFKNVSWQETAEEMFRAYGGLYPEDIAITAVRNTVSAAADLDEDQANNLKAAMVNVNQQINEGAPTFIVTISPPH